MDLFAAAAVVGAVVLWLPLLVGAVAHLMFVPLPPPSGEPHDDAIVSNAPQPGEPDYAAPDDAPINRPAVGGSGQEVPKQDQ